MRQRGVTPPDAAARQAGFAALGELFLRARGEETQQTVADGVGLSRNTYGRIERGFPTEPRLYDALAIGFFLDIPPGEIARALGLVDDRWPAQEDATATIEESFLRSLHTRFPDAERREQVLESLLELFAATGQGS